MRRLKRDNAEPNQAEMEEVIMDSITVVSDWTGNSCFTLNLFNLNAAVFSYGVNVHLL